MIKLVDHAAVPAAFQSDIERAVRILKEEGCGEVYLFGSLAEGHLRDGSDIDLAVRGCPTGKFFHVWGRLSDELKHPVDLVRLDDDEPFAEYLQTVGEFDSVAEKIISQINFEIGQIDRLFETCAEILDRMLDGKGNLADIMATASMLHSFYNGLENIWLAVAKRFDRSLPDGEEWHRQLLRQMAEGTVMRPRVISPELAHRLDMYLRFRHFFRHSYVFDLKWSALQDKVVPLREVWAQTKSELNEFVHGLGSPTE